MINKYKHYISSTIFVVLILVSFIAINLVGQKIIKRNRSHYEETVTEEIAADVKLKIENYIDEIKSIKRFVEERKTTGIDYNEFYLFSSGLFENDTSIENISIAPDAIHKFVYPIKHNHIVGYNLLRDKRREVVNTVVRAINENLTVINGPYPMRQDKTKNIVVIRYPIYYDSENFYGLINVVVNTTTLFTPHYSSQYRDIKFQIRDDSKELLFGKKLFDPIDTIESMPLKYFGWDIAFGRSKLYSNLIIEEDKKTNMLFSSVFMFSLIGGIIFIMTNGKTKLEKEKRTAELIITNKELSFQNGEKNKKTNELIIVLNELRKEKELTQKYLDDLVLAGNVFKNSIENAPIPIMIHAEDGTVLNISKNWTKLTNYTKSDIPTIFEWTKKAYGKNKDEVRDFIKKLYTLSESQHDGEFVVTTKDGRNLTWDFNSISLGDLPDGRTIAMSVAIDVTERFAREKKIKYLSYHDQLTGLYNRRFFEEQKKRLDNPRNLPLSIIVGDINGLKLTNDAFGHLVGDELLKIVGNIISKSIRGNDIAARWGGDEFIILLPTSGVDAAGVLINRILKKVKEVSFEYGSLSISFGSSTKKEKHEDIEEIFTNAEKLMYKNKLIEKKKFTVKQSIQS